MRDGYRVIDTDTHVGPSVETLEQFAALRRALWGELEAFVQPSSEGGHHPSIHPFRTAGAGTSPEGDLPQPPVGRRHR